MVCCFGSACIWYGLGSRLAFIFAINFVLSGLYSSKVLFMKLGINQFYPYDKVPTQFELYVQGDQHTLVSTETNDCWLLDLADGASEFDLQPSWTRLQLTPSPSDSINPRPVVPGVDQTLDLTPGSQTTHLVFGGDCTWELNPGENQANAGTDGCVQVLDLLGHASILGKDSVKLGFAKS